MGQLIIPNEIKIKGPWILVEAQLEELDEVLNAIEEKIDQSYEIELEKEVEKELPRLRQWEENLTKDEAELEVKNSYPFSNNEKFAVLLSKDGKKLKDATIIGLLKDKNINDFAPTELQIEIKKGNINFKLEINSTYNGELQTRISISDDSFANDINYLLNKWIRKHQPNRVVQTWNSTIHFFIFPMFILLFFITSQLLETDNDNYKEELKKEGNELLTNGISITEENRAIELILKLETDYVPLNYENESNLNSNIFKVWIYGSICLILIGIRPRTTIGIGRKKRLAWFYKKWIYVVTVFIPLTIILPIIKSKLF